MKTAFSTGPGFFAAATDKTDDTIASGDMRFFVARIEAYDGPARKDSEYADTEFKLLPVMCEGKPAVARALLQLHHHLGSNIALIRKEANL